MISPQTMLLEGPHGFVRNASFAVEVHAVVVDEDDELAEECPEEIATNVVFGALEQRRRVAE